MRVRPPGARLTEPSLISDKQATQQRLQLSSRRLKMFSVAARGGDNG
jgi:hypothetical protein